MVALVVQLLLLLPLLLLLLLPVPVQLPVPLLLLDILLHSIRNDLSGNYFDHQNRYMILKHIHFPPICNLHYTNLSRFL